MYSSDHLNGSLRSSISDDSSIGIIDINSDSFNLANSNFLMLPNTYTSNNNNKNDMIDFSQMDQNLLYTPTKFTQHHDDILTEKSDLSRSTTSNSLYFLENYDDPHQNKQSLQLSDITTQNIQYPEYNYSTNHNNNNNCDFIQNEDTFSTSLNLNCLEFDSMNDTSLRDQPFVLGRHLITPNSKHEHENLPSELFNFDDKYSQTILSDAGQQESNITSQLLDFANPISNSNTKISSNFSSIPENFGNSEFKNMSYALNEFDDSLFNFSTNKQDFLTDLDEVEKEIDKNNNINTIMPVNNLESLSNTKLNDSRVNIEYRYSEQPQNLTELFSKHSTTRLSNIFNTNHSPTALNTDSSYFTATSANTTQQKETLDNSINNETNIEDITLTGDNNALIESPTSEEKSHTNNSELQPISYYSNVPNHNIPLISNYTYPTNINTNTSITTTNNNNNNNNNNNSSSSSSSSSSDNRSSTTIHIENRISEPVNSNMDYSKQTVNSLPTMKSHSGTNLTSNNSKLPGSTNSIKRTDSEHFEQTTSTYLLSKANQRVKYMNDLLSQQSFDPEQYIKSLEQLHFDDDIYETTLDTTNISRPNSTLAPENFLTPQPHLPGSNCTPTPTHIKTTSRNLTHDYQDILMNSTYLKVSDNRSTHPSNILHLNRVAKQPSSKNIEAPKANNDRKRQQKSIPKLNSITKDQIPQIEVKQISHPHPRIYNITTTTPPTPTTTTSSSSSSCSINNTNDDKHIPYQESTPFISSQNRQFATNNTDSMTSPILSKNTKSTNYINDSKTIESQSLSKSDLITNSRRQNFTTKTQPTRKISETSISFSMPEGLDSIDLETNMNIIDYPLTNRETYKPQFIISDKLMAFPVKTLSSEEIFLKPLRVDINLIPSEDELVCCIGALIQTNLQITNESPFWIQCKLQFDKVTIIGGEIIDISSDQMPFSMHSRCVIGPGKIENIKITFTPSMVSIYTLELTIFLAKIVESFPSTPSQYFSFKATSVKPQLEVKYFNPNVELIDYGYVSDSKIYTQFFTLINKSACELPIRIEAPNASLNRHLIQLSLEDPLKREDKQSDVFVSSNIKKHGEITVWVIFQTSPPRKAFSPSAKFNTSINVLFECRFISRSASILAKIPIIATFSQPKLIVLESIDTVLLQSSVSTATSKSIAMQNAGNIPLTLSLEMSPPSIEFSIAPRELSLHPGQQSPALITFSPHQQESSYTGELKIKTKPETKLLSLTIYGKTSSTTSSQCSLPSTHSASHESNIVTRPVISSDYLHSNVLAMNWGGAKLQERTEKVIVLLNTSSETLQLEISTLQGAFFIKDPNTNKIKQVTHTQIQPQEKLPINLVFLPVSLTFYADKLSIKDLDHDKLFLVPLFGYGGQSSVVLDNAQEATNGYWTRIGEVRKNQNNTFKVYLCNKGNRRAYIKAECRDNTAERLLLASQHVTITPSELILAPQDYKSILVTYIPTNSNICSCEQSPHCVAYISLTTGDCIAWKCYFSQLRATGAHIPKEYEYLRKLFSLDLSDDENITIPVPTIQDPLPPKENNLIISMVGFPPTVNHKKYLSDTNLRPSSVPVTKLEAMDYQLFQRVSSNEHLHYISSSKLLLEPPDTLFSRKGSDPNIYASGSMEGSPTKTSYSDLQSPIKHKSTNTKRESFTIYPSTVTIHLDSSDPAKLYINNPSQQTSRFTVVFPKNLLQVSPARGFVEPECEIAILIKPTIVETPEMPSIQTHYITLHFEYSVRSIAVNFIKPSLDTSGPVRDNQTSQVEYLTPPNIIFSSILANTISDIEISFTNPYQFPIHWSLSSLGQASYQNSIDGVIEIFKTNYAVFFFHRLSGGVASKGTSKISVAFQPRHPGIFTQTWEMQLTKNVKVIDNLKLSISGKAEANMAPLKYASPPLKSNIDNSLKPAATTNTTNTVNTTTITTSSSSISSINKVYLEPDIVLFPSTKISSSNTLKVSIYNKADISIDFTVNELSMPFVINKEHASFTLTTRHRAKFPIIFQPTSIGSFEEVLIINCSTGKKLHAIIKGHSMQ